MQIDAGVVVAGQQQGVVGGPKRGRKHIGDARFAASIAGVAFCHADTDADCAGGRGCRVGHLLLLGDGGRLEQVSNRDIRVAGRAVEVVVMRQSSDVRLGLEGRPERGDLRQPIHF